MRFVFSYTLVLVILLSLNSCYKDENVDGQFSDEFYLRHEGADLPVWVRGNANAETFIFFVHGGPFDTAIEMDVWKYLEPLYQDYAMVFFDQRGGGYAHGERAVNLTEEQFVEDVEVVVQLIKDKYPQAANLFLMGHSWGGYLGTSFLKTGDNQLGFKGWIELAGAHNFQLNWLASRDFCINYALAKIASGSETGKWEGLLQRVQETPEITNYDELIAINSAAFEVAQDLNSGKSEFEEPSSSYILSSPAGIGFSQKNNRLMEELLVNGNLNPDMPSIVLPSLLIYGGEDPIVPIASGQNGYDFLGTPEEDKYLVVLENSGHSVWEYEIDEFFDAVTTFINQYE